MTTEERIAELEKRIADQVAAIEMLDGQISTLQLAITSLQVELDGKAEVSAVTMLSCRVDELRAADIA